MIKEYGENIDLAISENINLTDKIIILVVKKDENYFTGSLLDLASVITNYKLIHFIYQRKLFINLSLKFN